MMPLAEKVGLSALDLLSGKRLQGAFMIAAYPEADREWLEVDVGAMETVIETIRAVRNVRADLNLPPGTAVELFVFGAGADRLVPHESYLRRLAGVANIAYGNGGERPKGAATMQIENLGFCPFGEGGPTSARGETRLGGRIPVNPSGGLESKGHPIGATGLGQLFELTLQLRGEAGARQVAGARFAIAENGGGVYGIEEAACCVTILGG